MTMGLSDRQDLGLIRLHTIPACDRRVDGRGYARERYTALAKLLRSNSNTVIQKFPSNYYETYLSFIDESLPS